MKEQFIDVNFKAKSLALLDHCVSIIEQYLGQGLRLSLRQLYYQLVSLIIYQGKRAAFLPTNLIIMRLRKCNLLMP